jgi:predicted PurR-regulated permease PerM
VSAFLGTISTTEIFILANKISTYQNTLQQELIHQIASMQGHIKSLPPNVLDKVREYTSTLFQHLAETIRVILQYIINVTTSFSMFIVNFVLAIILAYFLSLESEFWQRFYREKAPRTVKFILQFLRESVITGIGRYVAADYKNYNRVLLFDMGLFIYFRRQ